MRRLTQNEWLLLSYAVTGLRANQRDMRYGQAVFNVLDLLCPEITAKIVMTELDPFYKDERVNELLRLICPL